MLYSNRNLISLKNITAKYVLRHRLHIIHLPFKNSAAKAKIKDSQVNMAQQNKVFIYLYNWLHT